MRTEFLFTLYLGLYLNVSAQFNVQIVDKKNVINNVNVNIEKTNWRGLSVVNDKTVWISGSNGAIAISNNGGNTFTVNQVDNCTLCDFRDIEAFDDKNAVIINSGYPAVIYKTNDGGNSWQEVFRKNDSSYFLDAMDFWDSKNGIIVADPIDGKFVLFETKDGGYNWQPVAVELCPKAYEGEAIFAASGTSIRCWGKKSFAFVSGGAQTRLFLFEKGLSKHEFFNIPLVSGKPSQGAFSLTKPFNGNLIAVSGGDYKDDLGENIAFAVFRFKNPLWFRSKFIEPLTGYKSCIEFIGSNTFLTCGTSGVDLVQNKNNYYINSEISGKSFNSICKAKKGNAVFLAGNKGVIAKVK